MITNTSYETIVTYIGLSSDAKPTDATANAIFFELNTGNLYYFTGETWAKVGG